MFDANASPCGGDSWAGAFSGSDGSRAGAFYSAWHKWGRGVFRHGVCVGGEVKALEQRYFNQRWRWDRGVSRHGGAINHFQAAMVQGQTFRQRWRLGKRGASYMNWQCVKVFSRSNGGAGHRRFQQECGAGKILDGSCSGSKEMPISAPAPRAKCAGSAPVGAGTIFNGSGSDSVSE